MRLTPFGRRGAITRVQNPPAGKNRHPVNADSVVTVADSLAQLSALQITAAQAMHSVAVMAVIEGQLGDLLPHARHRLHVLGDAHAAAAVEVIYNVSRGGFR